MEVNRTERGWAGHLIFADRCKFRRNTLLEYKDKAWVVSTVGCYIDSEGKVDMIGAGRWYETMVFEALDDEYKDADVQKSIWPESDWGIWGESWQDVKAQYPYPDLAANEMHEKVVAEMIERIKHE